MLITSAERVAPTSVIGTTVKGITNVHEALKHAGLDGEVKVSEQQVGVSIINESGVSYISARDKFMTYRTMPATGEYKPLGVVGKRYVPIQDSDAFDFLNLLVDESGATFDSVATLAGGTQSLVSIKMPSSIKVGGFDDVDLYLMAKNSHDGSSSLSIAVTPIRLRCLNQVTMALKNAPARISLHHTFGATMRVQQARETLGLVWKYQDAFELEVAKLLDQEYSDSQFVQLVEKLFPLSEEAKPAQITRVTETRDQVLSLWNAPTQNKITGSKWGAYNAVAEWADWYRPVRGKGNVDALRAERILSGATSEIKTKALALL